MDKVDVIWALTFSMCVAVCEHIFYCMQQQGEVSCNKPTDARWIYLHDQRIPMS